MKYQQADMILCSNSAYALLAETDIKQVNKQNNYSSMSS